MSPEFYKVEADVIPEVEDFFTPEEDTHIEYFDGYELQSVGFHFGEGDIVAKVDDEVYYMNLAGARNYQRDLYDYYWHIRELRIKGQ